MIVRLLTEDHLESLSLKGGCRGSAESTLVKMPHCWKSHAQAQIVKISARMDIQSVIWTPELLLQQDCHLVEQTSSNRREPVDNECLPGKIATLRP